MVRVCHFTSVHSTEDERIFYKECVSLASEGYEVILVGPGKSRKDKGVNVIGVGEKPLSRIKRMLFFSRIVYKKALSFDCDIYHFHDPELLSYALKLKKIGKIVIFDSHEDVPAQFDEKKYLPKIIRVIAAKYYIRLEKKVLKVVDAAISVTPHIVDRLNEYCKTIMVTNYPRISNSNIDKSNLDVKKEKAVCFTGTINEGWCHSNIAKSIGLLNDIEYHLYGKADKEYIKSLEELAGENKLIYKGFVKHDEILTVQSRYIAGMCLCDYCANTGWKIGTLGNTKIFEYMYAGIPIICTDFDLWKDIVDKYECGIYVNPNNVDEIAKAINYYVDNMETVAIHGENGRRAVIKEYTWQHEEKKLLNLYSSLVK